MEVTRRQQVLERDVRRRSSPGRSALFLVVAWMMSGFWDVSHALHHQHHVHESVYELELHDRDRCAAKHGHDHVHPDSPLTLAAAKSPTSDFAPAYSVSVEPKFSKTSQSWIPAAGPTLRAPDCGAVSGPRAPPNS